MKDYLVACAIFASILAWVAGFTVLGYLGTRALERGSVTLGAVLIGLATLTLIAGMGFVIWAKGQP